MIFINFCPNSSFSWSSCSLTSLSSPVLSSDPNPGPFQVWCLWVGECIAQCYAVHDVGIFDRWMSIIDKMESLCLKVGFWLGRESCTYCRTLWKHFLKGMGVRFSSPPKDSQSGLESNLYSLTFLEQTPCHFGYCVRGVGYFGNWEILRLGWHDERNITILDVEMNQM